MSNRLQPNVHERRKRRTGRLRMIVLTASASLVLAACGSGGAGSQDSAGGKGCDKAANYPRGPVQLIVPWAAGGGTDSVARFIGKELADRLDTQVNVVNRTGGSGVVGHSAIAHGRPDGSTIGLVTVEITMMHWQGLTDLSYKDITPVAQVNSDASGITVRKDAPWDSAKDLIADAKKNPGKFTASGTGRGGIWDLAMAGMLLEAGAEPDAIKWVPSEGAAPALQELVAGGVDISTASLVENKTMLDSGKVKAIGLMADKRDPKYPDLPTLKENGIDFEMSAWRGIAGPKGMDKDVVAELECNLDEIVHGKEYKDFMTKTGFGIEWRDAAEFGKFMAEQDKTKGEIMKAAGLTQ
ncbi:MAG: Bug family tripartite tricarboxylate transporter substrate binding protein [Nocardioidaceae bacterium]